MHYPEFFSQEEVERRERHYRAFCANASAVCVQAEWTKQDLIRHFALESSKITVIPWGSILDAQKKPEEPEIDATVKKYNLSRPCFVYPAATWPHKNHQLILHALSILKRAYRLEPQILFTGSTRNHKEKLESLALELGVHKQVRYLGFLEERELQAVYLISVALIFPSRFEGFGLPILEAFEAGLPVVSSNATTLPEVAGGAAMYFDPDAPDELASHMKSILENHSLREKMAEQGKMALSRFSMQETARRFQSLYDRIAKRSCQLASGNQNALGDKK